MDGLFRCEEEERQRDKEREREKGRVKGVEPQPEGDEWEGENQISTKFAQNHYYYGRSLQTMRSGFQILIL